MWRVVWNLGWRLGGRFVWRVRWRFGGKAEIDAGFGLECLVGWLESNR